MLKDSLVGDEFTYTFPQIMINGNDFLINKLWPMTSLIIAQHVLLPPNIRNRIAQSLVAGKVLRTVGVTLVNCSVIVGQWLVNCDRPEWGCWNAAIEPNKGSPDQRNIFWRSLVCQRSHKTHECLDSSAFLLLKLPCSAQMFL